MDKVGERAELYTRMMVMMMLERGVRQMKIVRKMNRMVMVGMIVKVRMVVKVEMRMDNR